MLLNKDKIFQIDDRKEHVDVPVPEWGGTVRLSVMTGAERDNIESWVSQRKQTNQIYDNFRARMIAVCAVDENGNKLFTSKDVEELGKKNALVLDRLHQAALKLNGMDVTVSPEETKVKN